MYLGETFNKIIESGKRSEGYSLSAKEGSVSDGVNVRLIDRAFAYDEV